MRYLALACDYDGTLARGGAVDDTVLAALGRLRQSGRRTIMVTGREMQDLGRVFSHFEMFDYIVAENGATLYHPATRTEKPLSERPPEEFVNELRLRGVAPLSVGQVIVATWQPHETVVLQTICDLGLELHVIFNKGAVMIVPSGVNKATGLLAALAELQLSQHNVVAVGDAENDHALLTAAEVGVAVANAIPTLIERADLSTRGRSSEGVVELIELLLADDLTEVTARLTRHHIVLGHAADGSEVALPPQGGNVLISGVTGSGKSTLTAALLSRAAERGYQVCLIDPAGDYHQLPGAVAVGSTHEPPDGDDVVALLEEPLQNVVVNLHGVAAAERPQCFVSLLARLDTLRRRTGRPHWIVVDDAHQVLPARDRDASLTTPQHFDGMVLISAADQGQIAAHALAAVDAVILLPAPTASTGGDRDRSGVLHGLPATFPTAAVEELKAGAGQAVYWCQRTGIVQTIKLAPMPPQPRVGRKYAQGDLGDEHSFYFHGPEGKLNLRAPNLTTFLQLADGVDDDTWLYHLVRGDYAKWFAEELHDATLSEDAAGIAEQLAGSAKESRAALRAAVQARYHLAAAEQPSLRT